MKLLPLLAAFTATFAIAAAEDPPETVLFAFDDYSLPFNKGLVLTLAAGHKSTNDTGLGVDPKHPNKPVLAIGKKGDPDEKRVYFCGTVIHVNGEYKMWYSGHDGSLRRVCHAVSKDGVSWVKPKLGLVEYKGGKKNNLVAIDGEAMKGMIILVLHDPEDPDPARRYKMIREVTSTLMLAAVSADGLSWQSAAGNQDILKNTTMEPSGFIKRHGLYYLNGHGGPVPHPIPSRGTLRPQKRMMVTLVSPDFENWTDAGHVSFRRDNVPPRLPLDFEFHRGEQVHLGASLWDRGNVVLGFYGQYHNETNDRRTSSCDLGLVISPDALHFKEPVPDFKILPGYEEPDRAEPRVTQGMGFQNIGDRTFLYYGIWTENVRDSPTGVRIATWPRDRLGYFSPPPGMEGAHCISSAITTAPGARIYLNVTGLSEASQVTVEILDEQFRPLPGYAAADFVPIQGKSGLRLPVAWRGKETLEKLAAPIRVRFNWNGTDPEAIKLYAIYIAGGS
ncbi:MAG: hypothetical protein U0984_13710 [Prosthecobacter sp.]|nr:hypothetical protein [Prosthecobacter sp.]